MKKRFRKSLIAIIIMEVILLCACASSQTGSRTQEAVEGSSAQNSGQEAPADEDDISSAQNGGQAEAPADDDDISSPQNGGQAEASADDDDISNTQNGGQAEAPADGATETTGNDISVVQDGYSDGNAVNTNNIERAADMEWWRKTNVCEIYVRSFNDSDGDGIGDLNGITEKLDYLKELGVGAIWLTPCYKSPQADNGYDIADYYKIDETFGTMEDMENLIAEAKKREIRIVMDLVFNHTSDQNSWFIESSSGKDNSKSDWYIWQDAKPDGSAPTNWRSIFGGSAWTWSERRGQYYLHTFLSEQPDLNWENPDVRNTLYEVANFWLDKGVGGFRLDAITYIKKPAFTDGKPDAEDGMTAIHGMTANTEGILDFLHEFKRNVREGKDIFTVGEANGVKASDLPLWVGREGVFDMVFEFSHILIGLKDETNWADRSKWVLTDLKKLLTESQKNTAENGWYPIFFENHDQPRSIDHYFPGVSDSNMAAKVIGTLQFTLRGTPFIYQGQELGFRNVEWYDISDYNDISTKNHYDFLIGEGYSAEEAMDAVHRLSRDSARTPMQWTAGKNAGFTDGTPWLPVNDNYETCNAESEGEDPDSVLSWYRTMAGIRSSHDELIEGNYEEILCDDEQIYGFIRRGSTAEAIILTNFTEEPAEYDASIVEGAELVISSAGSSTPGVLAPLESAVYESKID